MAKHSAGILVYRRKNDAVEVLLVHPAGPFWAKKDTWSIPKGEIDDGEELMSAARREYKEEVGLEPPNGPLQDLGQSKQGNKTNYIWAVEGDVDASQFECTSTFELEWPPKSGRQQSFPENDRAQWFSLAAAKQKLYKAQTVFIDRLAEFLHIRLSDEYVNSQDAKPQQSSLF